MKKYKVFAINPGSTSTKIALFQGNKEIFSQNITHEADELKKFQEILDQLAYRKKAILEALEQAHQSLEGTDAFERNRITIRQFLHQLFGYLAERMLQDAVVEDAMSACLLQELLGGEISSLL